MLDNCEPDSRHTVQFDGQLLHVIYSCRGFTSDVGRDGIENDRTPCEGTFAYTFDVTSGPEPDAPGFTQSQWDADKIEIEEISRSEFIRLTGPDPETGEPVTKTYGFAGEKADHHLDYGQY